MPLTQPQLADAIRAALDERSGDETVDPAEARQHFADSLAIAIFAAMVGRTVSVTGVSATGGAVTGTGIIQ